MRVGKADIGRTVLLAEGAFSRVYRLHHYQLPGDHTALAYKEFRPEEAEQARSAEAVVSFRDLLNPADRAELDRCTVWPRAVVEDRGAVVGLLMPLLPSEFFFETTDPANGEATTKLRELQWLIATPAQLAENGVANLDKTERLTLLAHLVYAVGLLHKHNWVFGDLSFKNAAFAVHPPRMILLDCDGAASVNDPLRKQAQSLGWEPPECAQVNIQDGATDVYKLGLAILRCLTPGRGAATARDPGRLSGELDAAGLALVERAVSADRARRPTAQELYRYLRHVVAERIDARPGPAAPSFLPPPPARVPPPRTGPGASIIEVAIGLASGHDLRVEVVNSPAGQASAVVSLDTETLIARRTELENAVLTSTVPRRRILGESEQSVQEVGKALFSALLGTGEVAGLYRASAALAQERGQRLRVVLRLDDPRLAALPWEAMYDQAAGGYVCRRNELVRQVPIQAAAAPISIDPPLRILGVVSAPRDQHRLNIRKEQEQLTQAVGQLIAAGRVHLEWAPSATWASLQDMLLSGTWHVLHYIGHGDYDHARDEGILALTGEDGYTHLVEASRLVDLLCQARPVPRMIVLNSCSGATTGVTDLFSGTAAALVQGGVSAVTAMQYEITDPAAIAFARGFYGAIAHGRSLDEAVSSGRVAIIGLSSQTLEWVTPVLYLRHHDSRIFA